MKFEKYSISFFRFGPSLLSCLTIGFVLMFCLEGLRAAAPGPSLSATFNEIPQGSVVNLTSEGGLDWVHWGLYTDTSLDRKAGVVPQISDFTVLYDTNNVNGYAYVYRFADNYNGYSWSDGTPTATVTNTTTGVWAYGIPLIGSGFEVTAPADTNTRTLKVYVGAYGARGKFEAFLSDGSARGYTNSSAILNMANGPSGVFSVTYAAAAASQKLVVRWTVSIAMRPDGNVTLQSAALTSQGANNPPYVALTAPANNAQFSAGDNVTIVAMANDTDGTVTKVEFFEGSNKLGEDAGSPYSFSWNNVSAGHYVLSARVTDNQFATSVSGPVEIFVSGTGGSLSGTLTLPPTLPTTVNLTAEGTGDWAHWGLATNNLFNHKASVVQQISDFTKIGSDPVKVYGDNYTAYGWNDGTPTGTTNNVKRGVFTTGVTNGFEIMVPADTTARRLKVYVGLYGAQGNFQAWLSDFSAPAYVDMSLSNYFDNVYGVYTLTYAAASAGQTLTIRYRALNLFDQDFGNVTLQAAMLVVNPGKNPVMLVNPKWSQSNFVFSFVSELGNTYDVEYTDVLGSGTWNLLSTLSGTGSSISVTNANPTPKQRFYQVKTR